MALPMRLDAARDAVFTGAIIRHQTDDYNAVVIDTIPGVLACGGDGYILAAKQEWDGSGDLGPEHYKTFRVDDETEWMLVGPGSDFALGDGE